MSNPYTRQGVDDDTFSYEFSSLSIAPLSVPSATGRPSQLPPLNPNSPQSGSGSPVQSVRSGVFYSIHAPPDYVPPRISPPVRITRPPGSSALLIKRPPSPTAKFQPSAATASGTSNLSGGETLVAEAQGGSSGWDEVVQLLDLVAGEFESVKLAYAELQAERTKLQAQVSIMQNQLDNVEQIRNAYEDRLKGSDHVIDKLKADHTVILSQAKDKLAQQSAAMHAREGQLLQHIKNYEQAHVSQIHT